MARKPREMVIALTLTPAQYKLVKERADENWLDPAAWVLMMLKRMSEGQPTVFVPQFSADPAARLQQYIFNTNDHNAEAPKAGTALPEDELDAIVGEKLADVLPEDAGAYDQPPARTAEVRPLHRPPVPFSPQTQPHHLKGLA